MKKNIPYGRQHIDKADIKSVVNVLGSDWITQGPNVSDFETALAKYCGAKYAVAVSSGTAALHIACLAAGLKKDDEAITTPFTFLATANAVIYAGAKPVFTDIENETLNINVGDIQKNISRKTKVILPVHFAGLPCDMLEISSIARNNGLKVIEDACHALGAEYRSGKKWIKVGSCRHSDMTVFSFHPVKHITTGEGGAVLTNRKDLYEKLMVLRSHGTLKNKNRFCNYPDIVKNAGPWYYEMQELGFNYRLTDIQCALGISQLKKLERFVDKRKKIVKMYNEAFKDNYFFDIPVEKDYARSSWHLYVIRLKDKYVGMRKKAFVDLRKMGIGVQVHYIPIHLQPYYQKRGYKRGLCPKAERCYETVISLPLYFEMTNKEIKTVIKVVRSVMMRAGD